ncbi:hypothetical protein RI367_005057 [Sorochytrium milnesiophthora]
MAHTSVSSAASMPSARSRYRNRRALILSLMLFSIGYLLGLMALQTQTHYHRTMYLPSRLVSSLLPLPRASHLPWLPPVGGLASLIVGWAYPICDRYVERRFQWKRQLAFPAAMLLAMSMVAATSQVNRPESPDPSINASSSSSLLRPASPDSATAAKTTPAHTDDDDSACDASPAQHTLRTNTLTANQEAACSSSASLRPTSPLSRSSPSHPASPERQQQQQHHQPCGKDVHQDTRIRKHEWGLVLRCVGAFVGLNYAASKLPSPPIVAVTITLITLAVFYSIDKTPQGFTISVIVASVGTWIAHLLVLNGYCAFTTPDLGLE